MAELSVFHSLRAIEHYLHFKPIARPLFRKKKSLAWQLHPLLATEAGADPIPAGQGCTGLLWDALLCKGDRRSLNRYLCGCWQPPASAVFLRL